MTGSAARRRDLATTGPTSELVCFHGNTARPPAAPVSTFVRPKWLLTHLLMLVLAVTMVLLGRWQLDVSNTKHFDLQNFAYAFQWWIFSGFVLFFWVRLIRNTRRPPAEKDTRLVMRTESGDRLDDGRYRGLAQLVIPGADGESRVSYVGYVMPRSAAAPARSDGDSYHAAYNDMLWGLAEAAGEHRTEPPGIGTAPAPVVIEADTGPDELAP